MKSETARTWRRIRWGLFGGCFHETLCWSFCRHCSCLWETLSCGVGSTGTGGEIAGGRNRNIIEYSVAVWICWRFRSSCSRPRLISSCARNFALFVFWACKKCHSECTCTLLESRQFALIWLLKKMTAATASSAQRATMASNETTATEILVGLFVTRSLIHRNGPLLGGADSPLVVVLLLLVVAKLFTLTR